MTRSAPAGRPRLARRARLRYDERDGRWMILWPERGLALNRTSADIVRMLDGAHSVDDIVTELGTRAGARTAEDLGRIASDVNAFLADLERRALLEWIA